MICWYKIESFYCVFCYKTQRLVYGPIEYECLVQKLSFIVVDVLNCVHIL